MVVARKNVRDFRGSVINPRDHLVLPDKRRLSRNDVSELLSNQEFWADNPHMRSLIPQLLEYMVSPYNGKPTQWRRRRRKYAVAVPMKTFGIRMDSTWSMMTSQWAMMRIPHRCATEPPHALPPTPHRCATEQPHARPKASCAMMPPKERYPPLIAASSRRICHLVHEIWYIPMELLWKTTAI